MRQLGPRYSRFYLDHEGFSASTSKISFSSLSPGVANISPLTQSYSPIDSSQTIDSLHEFTIQAEEQMSNVKLSTDNK